MSDKKISIPAELKIPIIVFCGILVAAIVVCYYSFTEMSIYQLLVLIPSVASGGYVLVYLRTGQDKGAVLKYFEPMLGGKENGVKLDDIGVMCFCISMAIVICHVAFHYMNGWLQLLWIPASATGMFLGYLHFVLHRQFLPAARAKSEKLETDILAAAFVVATVVGVVFGLFSHMSPWLQAIMCPAFGYVLFEAYRRFTTKTSFIGIEREPIFLGCSLLTVSILLTYLALPGLPDMLAIIVAPALAAGAFFGLNTYVFNKPAAKVNLFNQELDHYNFGNNETFGQRYLMYDGYFGGAGHPVVFYTGNEGDIELFWNNTGFAFVIAQELRALVVFGEHRYYGQTLPFGPKRSFDKDKLGWLTTEQALGDYATLLTALRPKFGFGKVLALGGSYGGMLAAWFRMKYPNVVDAALAASAPVLGFPGVSGFNEYGFMEICTDDFRAAGCADSYARAFSAIAGSGDFPALQRQFGVCEAFDSAAPLLAWLEGSLTYACMVDYGTPADFLEPLPAWPVAAMCRAGDAAHGDLERLALGVQLYLNYTGQAGTCFSLNSTTTGALGMTSWDYQACTEMVLPTPSNGKTDMFPPQPFDLDAYARNCQAQFGVTPRPHWAALQWGAGDVAAHSHIIFSNGMLDPWRAGGIQTTLNKELPAILIKEGAHHADLRTPTPEDPPSVVQARQLEMEYIKNWIL